MTVRISESQLRVGVMVFEARFDDGARYLDSCGSLISAIRKFDPNWKAADTVPQQGSLVNAKNKLNCIMDMNRVSISKNSNDPIEQKKANQIAAALESNVAFIYPKVTQIFEVPNTTRVGVRFSFIATADSMEDAEKFLVRGGDSDLMQQISKTSNSEPFSAVYRFSVDEGETGYRRNFHLTAIKFGENANDGDGFPDPEDQSKAAVLVDIDTYTRPESGHFDGAPLFIKRSYLRSLGQSAQILHWIAQRQKGSLE